MSLVEKILPYEKEVFLWLNDYHNTYWDTFMWMYTEKLSWLLLAIVALVVFVYKTNWKEALLLIICATILGMLTDYFSANVIKPFFVRLRPSHHPDFYGLVEIVNNYRGGRYGFISIHAANGFGIFVFSSLIFKYRYLTLTMALWAIVSVYSRIYLGVHFLSDIMGGILWGTFAAFLVYYIYLTSRRYILKVPKEEVRIPVYSKDKAHILMATVGITVILIAIYSAIFDIPQ